MINDRTINDKYDVICSQEYKKFIINLLQISKNIKENTNIMRRGVSYTEINQMTFLEVKNNNA